MSRDDERLEQGQIVVFASLNTSRDRVVWQNLLGPRGSGQALAQPPRLPCPAVMLLNASINPLTEDDMPMSLPNLPNLDLRFFVPRLQDRPQNPIVDGLKFTSVLGSTLKQAMVPKPPLQLSPLSAEAEADRLLSSDQAHHRMDWASLPRLDTPITVRSTFKKNKNETLPCYRMKLCPGIFSWLMKNSPRNLPF